MRVAAIQGHSWLSQTHAIVLTACPTMVPMGREEECASGNNDIDFLFFYYSDSVALLSFVLILQKTNKTTTIKQKPTRFVTES